MVPSAGRKIALADLAKLLRSKPISEAASIPLIFEARGFRTGR